MIGRECRYKNSRITGKIMSELPNDWGVYWYSSIDGYKPIQSHSSKWIAFIDLFRRTKHNVYGGLLHYWQNKEDIKILYD